jgi:hypothetical protein
MMLVSRTSVASAPFRERNEIRALVQQARVSLASGSRIFFRPGKAGARSSGKRWSEGYK